MQMHTLRTLKDKKTTTSLYGVCTLKKDLTEDILLNEMFGKITILYSCGDISESVQKA